MTEKVVDLKDHPCEEEQSPALATTIPEEKICSVIGHVEEVQQPCSWEEEQEPANVKTPPENEVYSMKEHLGGQQLRPSTSFILQKLMKYRTPVKPSGPSPMRSVSAFFNLTFCKKYAQSIWYQTMTVCVS